MHYRKHPSLEPAFTHSMNPGTPPLKTGLAGFYEYFFADRYSRPHRKQYRFAGQELILQADQYVPALDGTFR